MPMRRNSHINDILQFICIKKCFLPIFVLFFSGLLHKTFHLSLSHVSSKAAGNFQGVVGF